MARNNSNSNESKKEILSKRLKELRGERTFRDMERITGISHNSWSSYEKGNTYPRTDTIYLLAKSLNVSVPFLIGTSETRMEEKIVVDFCEYTGLSKDAVENLHLCKSLKELELDLGFDPENNLDKQQPFYYYTSALLSSHCPISVDALEYNIEYYCKTTKELRETESRLDEVNGRKDELERMFQKYNKKTNGLMEIYYDQHDRIDSINRYNNGENIYIDYSEDDRTIEELKKDQNDLSKKISSILHIPDIKSFIENFLQAGNDYFECLCQIEKLKNHKARVLMEIIEILDYLSTL